MSEVITELYRMCAHIWLWQIFVASVIHSKHTSAADAILSDTTDKENHDSGLLRYSHVHVARFLNMCIYIIIIYSGMYIYIYRIIACMICNINI